MKGHREIWIGFVIAGRFGLSEGDRVEIAATDEQIIISLPRRHYRLEDLLSGMAPEAMHDAFDWGPDVGREVVDE